jgi:hypothetical protein
LPRWLKVAASIVTAVIGFVWFVLDFIGNAATVFDFFEWAPLWVRKLAAHEELAYQIGPWVLKGLGAGCKRHSVGRWH